MKPTNSKKTTGAVNAAKTKARKGQRKTPEVVLPFSAVHVSKWNRSFGVTLDEKYVKELATDIKQNGLIHPLTLVKRDSDESPFAVLAGANRLGALCNLRGKKSGLMKGEYVIREGITEDDPKCLDISLSENGHHRQPAVIETARYIDRLLQQEQVDQGRLAKKLHLRREVVNRCGKLVQFFDQLPQSWQGDLSRSPSQKAKSAPVITLSHWVEVAGAVDGEEIPPEVKGVLEQAAKDRWSTRALRKALKEPGDGHGNSKKATHTPAKQNPIPRDLVEKALEAIKKAAAATKTVLPDQVERLNQAAQTVQSVLHQIKANDVKNKSKKSKATKKAA